MSPGAPIAIPMAEVIRNLKPPRFIILSKEIAQMLKEDHELIRGVADGDQDAFIKLYDRYSSRVYGLSLRMLRDTMLAEEITQDAFLKLWTRAHTFRSDRGTLLGWLLTITRRTALDRIRIEARKSRSSTNLDQDGFDWLPDPISTTDESRWGTLRFAVAELPATQRQVIGLAFYQGLSQSQISEHLNIPLGTVKTRVRLGMNKLRESLLNNRLHDNDRSETNKDDVKYDERYR